MRLGVSSKFVRGRKMYEKLVDVICERVAGRKDGSIAG